MSLNIVPVGGLGEIGLNCMAFEFEDEIFVVDCGVLFSDLNMLGVDFLIPDFSYLRENAHKIKAYIITHAHEDHIGALPYVLRDCPAPIYATAFAQKMIEAKLLEHKIAQSTTFYVFAPLEVLEFKHFKVTPVPVNHSIIEAMALLIESPVGKIVFTGDFKIDPNPFYGSPLDEKPFLEFAKDGGVRLLMSDSTNVERVGNSESESSLYESFDRFLSKQSGLLIISLFASNIARIGQIFDVAAKYGKRIALLGRAMDQNIRLAFESGYLKNMNDVLIRVDAIDNYPRQQVVVLSTGSQGESRAALSRIAFAEHKALKLREGDTVVMSSKAIPGNEKSVSRVINHLFRQGADVIYSSQEKVHVSGHATANELAHMMQMVKPQFFMPVHGEYRHLVLHSRLAVQNGVKKENAVVAVNGDVWRLTADSLTKIDHREENRVFIESSQREDVAKIIVRERKKIAETGIVFAVLIRDVETGRVLSGPEILSKGFLDLDQASHRDLVEKAKEVVLSVLLDVDSVSDQKFMNLAEEVRIGLRRFFDAKVGVKPVVMPVVIEV